jgi:hypothetical protein
MLAPGFSQSRGGRPSCQKDDDDDDQKKGAETDAHAHDALREMDSRIVALRRIDAFVDFRWKKGQSACRGMTKA